MSSLLFRSSLKTRTLNSAVHTALSYQLVLTKSSGHNAVMYSCDGSTVNVDNGVSTWITQGFPAEKIMMGLPIYGRSFTLADR